MKSIFMNIRLEKKQCFDIFLISMTLIVLSAYYGLSLIIILVYVCYVGKGFGIFIIGLCLPLCVGWSNDKWKTIVNFMIVIQVMVKIFGMCKYSYLFLLELFTKLNMFDNVLAVVHRPK